MCESEEDSSGDEREKNTRRLDPVETRDYTFDLLLSMEAKGKLQLRPFYQRGFKWKQKQSSLWIESILRGYPCLPEITLLQTDTRGCFAVFDGQQRLTSLKLFIEGKRAAHWTVSNKDRKNNVADTFALEGMAIYTHLEGKTFKQLSDDEQTQILSDYNIRCAIIPRTWVMADFIDFFQRIQGGGTPMSMHELRRAITHGSFTLLLDKQALTENMCSTAKLLSYTLRNFKLETDERQDLLLRFYTLQRIGSNHFSTRSTSQQGLETMKVYNAHAETTSGSIIRDLTLRLETGMEVTSQIFGEDVFKRAMPLTASKPDTRVWSSSTRANRAVWDCMLYCMCRPERKHAILAHAPELQWRLIHVMQTHRAFETMKMKGTEDRILEVDTIIKSVVYDTTPSIARPLSIQVRNEIITAARKRDAPCSICGQALPFLDDLIHVDHSVARARGGSSNTSNLGPSHKTCNLQKGASSLTDNSPGLHENKRQRAEIDDITNIEPVS